MFHTNRVPRLHRPAEGDCRLILPYEEGVRSRVKIKSVIGTRCHVEGRKTPQGFVWTFNRTHFTKMVDFLDMDYHVAIVYLDSFKDQECDYRCTNAYREECVCSCGGKNHGGLRDYLSEWDQRGTTVSVDDKVQRTTYLVGFERDVLEPWQLRKLGV